MMEIKQDRNIKKIEEHIFHSKGYKNFILTSTGLIIDTHDKNYYLKNNSQDEGYVNYILNNYPYTFNIYDKMSGMDFLECVQGGGFIDYDGTLSEVVVDGYISNLGLNCRGMHQGDFQVDENIWEDICNQYDVWVNWANK